MTRRIALLVGSAALMLVALECGARLVLEPPRYHDGAVEFTPGLGFRGVPGHRHEARDEAGPFSFSLNDQGLRGPSIPTAPADARVRRIAFVGDSFLVAAAVRDEALVTNRVETALGASGEAARVYNLSAVDYGTAQQLLLLRELGPRIAPEAVILFLYPANDVINNSIELAGRAPVSAGDYLRPYLVQEEGEGTLSIRYTHPIRAWLRHHLLGFAIIEREVLALATTRGIAWLLPWSSARGPVERVAAGRAPREDFELFLRHDPGDAWESAWRSTFALLRAFRDECARLGARVLVVVVPSIHQVQRTAKGISLDVVTRLVAGQPLDQHLDWNLPERRLARFFDGEGIGYVLLLPGLRDASGPGAGVYSRDEHLGPRGHEVAAKAVLGWLGSQADVSPPPLPSGSPVRVLPAAAGVPPLLDFARDPHFDNLGDGWLDWEAGVGWSVGWRSLIAVPAGSGDFVVRGRVEEGSRLPIRGAVAIVGRAPERLRAGRTGAFEARFAGAASPPIGPSSDGYLPVLLSLDGNGRAGRAVPGLTVREIGFETPAASGASSEP